ncbi:unnamed protein product [Haemonchus placei]|uniref:Uncharacterized protein n=1 Tax=Haemonchus placei TaxID=6290 RepID=A0A0N4X8B8_HAEPC|nr:unnamed protein product [Haemonchus placei]
MMEDYEMRGVAIMGINERDALRKASKPVLPISWESCDLVRGSPKPANRGSHSWRSTQPLSQKGPQIHRGGCGPRRLGGSFDRTERAVSDDECLSGPRLSV